MNAPVKPPSPLFLDFWSGLSQNNPVFVQMLGLCPAMAVSNSLANGLAMGLATTFVLLCSSVLISAVRHYIANEVRLTSYILIIATFVTVADMVLAAGFPEISKALGPFIPLIVVNCIVLARVEAFAAKNTPLIAAWDGAMMGVGMVVAIAVLGGLRELIGTGLLFSGIEMVIPGTRALQVLPADYPGFLVAILPPGAFLVLGFMIAGRNWLDARAEQRTRLSAPAQAAA